MTGFSEGCREAISAGRIQKVMFLLSMVKSDVLKRETLFID